MQICPIVIYGHGGKFVKNYKVKHIFTCLQLSQSLLTDAVVAHLNVTCVCRVR